MEEATNEIRDVADNSGVPTEICEPVVSLDQLWTVVENPPKWIQRIVNLSPRSAIVVQNVQNDCHVGKKNFAPKLRLDRNSTPRTLVCHDMMNGYLEDKYANPVKVGNKYTFYRWSQIDIFIYFSHKFITIPPLCWINVAHQNGVKILGTFITEWKEGEEIFKVIFESHTAIDAVVKAMVDLCVLFKLDGWFLNVENKIEDPTKLKYFVKTLTDEVHKRTPNGLVIWYDSVTESGTLTWQNELNDANRCFFDICDGIFINYTWDETNMANTATAAEHRALDVYVGIDIFGRHTYGGGKFNSYKAAEQIRKFGFSMAIFAQGWTYETLAKEPEHNYLERFLNRDNAFWRCLWPFLYTHPLTNLFNTSFYIGTDKEWYKLIHQETQLSKFPHSKDLHEEFEELDILKNECRCLQLHPVDKYTAYYLTKDTLPPSESESVHHLFSCDIPVQGKTVLYYHTKRTNENQLVPALELILLFQNASGSVTKIVCSVKGAQEKTPNGNTTLVQVCPKQQMQDFILHVGIPEDWQMQCFEIDFGAGKIIEIGADLLDSESIYLCGFGIIKQERLKDI